MQAQSKTPTPIEMHDAIQTQIHDICEMIRHCDFNINDYIAHFIAAICDIEYEDLIGEDKRYFTSQCRWLYWYAYRYMTNEPYANIAKRMKDLGREYTTSAIIIGVNRMARLIEDDSTWHKRWVLTKRIIKEHQELNLSENDNNGNVVNIVIQKPKDTFVKVSFKDE